MNSILNEYYSQLYHHNNNLPKAPQTEHVKKRTVISKRQKYKKRNDSTSYINTLPLINIERGTCPECDCRTYSYDSWRGEKVCPQCGLVLEEGIAQQPYHKEIYRKPNKSLTWEEKRFLRKYGHHRITTDSKEWWNNYDNKTIKCLTSQAMMNKRQKMETQYIIDNIGFKKLHSRANKPEIICAVIRYVLKKENYSSSLLRYNQGIFKENLTKEIYDIVENNIKKYFRNEREGKDVIKTQTG